MSILSKLGQGAKHQCLLGRSFRHPPYCGLCSRNHVDHQLLSASYIIFVSSGSRTCSLYRDAQRTNLRNVTLRVSCKNPIPVQKWLRLYSQFRFMSKLANDCSFAWCLRPSFSGTQLCLKDTVAQREQSNTRPVTSPCISAKRCPPASIYVLDMLSEWNSCRKVLR